MRVLSLINLKFNHCLVECPYQVNEITARKMLLFAFLTLHYLTYPWCLRAHREHRHQIQHLGQKNSNHQVHVNKNSLRSKTPVKYVNRITISQKRKRWKLWSSNLPNKLMAISLFQRSDRVRLLGRPNWEWWKLHRDFYATAIFSYGRTAYLR